MRVEGAEVYTIGQESCHMTQAGVQDLPVCSSSPCVLDTTLTAILLALSLLPFHVHAPCNALSHVCRACKRRRSWWRHCMAGSALLKRLSTRPSLAAAAAAAGPQAAGGPAALQQQQPDATPAAAAARGGAPAAAAVVVRQRPAGALHMPAGAAAGGPAVPCRSMPLSRGYPSRPGS